MPIIMDSDMKSDNGSLPDPSVLVVLQGVQRVLPTEKAHAPVCSALLPVKRYKQSFYKVYHTFLKYADSRNYTPSQR